MVFTSFRRRFRALIAMDDRLRVERAIAFSRLLVAFGALFAILLDPNQPAVNAPATLMLLFLYSVAAVFLFIRVRKMSRLPRGFALIAHLADIAVTATLTIWTDGPNNPYFALLLCVLMAAAYRWGFYETAATTVAAAGLVSLEAVLFHRADGISSGFAFIEGQVSTHGTITRMLYLGIVGLFLGYLGEQQQQRRREAAAIASVGRDAWVSAGIQGLLESTLGMVVKLFGAARAVVVINDPRSAHATIWRCEPISGSDGLLISSDAPDDDSSAPYLSINSEEGWHAVARRGRKKIDLVSLNNDGRKLPPKTSPVAASFMSAYGCRTALSVPVHFQQTVTGRVFLIEPRVGFDRENAVRILQGLARAIGPAARNVYRLRRLRSRAEAVERGRIARDLHDGILQVLMAAELRMDLVRRKVEAAAPEEGEELANIQTLLSDEARSVRLLTRRMQLPFSATEELQTGFVDMISRFERETGITARFDGYNEGRVAPRTRYELLRILQEGLVNIRKHSGAKHVNVRLAGGDGMLRLLIEDDGRGFPFAGRRSQTQLEANDQGPLIIRERVRALRGELNVESIPGKGSCLDVKVPLHR